MTKNETSFYLDEKPLNIKAEVLKFLKYWPWFVTSLILAFLIAFFYLRYTPRIYNTNSKIKILDKSDGLLNPADAFSFKSKVNLDNDTEILKSYIILERVVKKLKLNTKFFEEGHIQTSQIHKLPFFFQQTVLPDSITKPLSYKIEINKNDITVYNLKNEKELIFKNHTTLDSEHDLPFQLQITNPNVLKKNINKTYLVKSSTVQEETLKLRSAIKIEQISDEADILNINLQGESKELSESIINTLVKTYNRDGINDKQLVSKRTLEFIDERFVYLASELDSIELGRQQYKQDNNFIDIKIDAELDIENNNISDAQLFKKESQLELATEFKKILDKKSNTLLPANFGLEDSSISQVVQNYNDVYLKRKKFSVDAGANNPNLKILDNELSFIKTNINQSVDEYINQLNVAIDQLSNRKNRFSGEVSQLPKKEKLLRSIERQQKIKESLYLLLLQKREEAAIELAITEPTIKLVEYALSDLKPISPKPKIVYAAAFLVSLLLPFGVLYLIFTSDTKIQGREDFDHLKSVIPLVGEIPKIDDNNSKIFNSQNDRSILAESFRILSSNVKFTLPSKNDGGTVILLTSSIKGEGKTFISLNLSLALSGLGKKTLVIGCDLRNPKLHSNLDLDKNIKGLTDYLYDDSVDWKKLTLQKFNDYPDHDILLSGSIPPNPFNLLSNGRLEVLLEEARQYYDYIIIDSSPVVLVSDTLLISHLADTSLYVVKAGHTEKELLEFAQDLHNNKKLKNMSFVLNAVGANKRSYGYNYGYGYGYGATD